MLFISQTKGYLYNVCLLFTYILSIFVTVHARFRNKTDKELLLPNSPPEHEMQKAAH